MKRLTAILLAAMVMLTGCGGGETAEQATIKALDALKVMDTETIDLYFGGDLSGEMAQEGDEEAKQLVVEIMKNFTYKIVSVTKADGGAVAEVEVTNADMTAVMTGVMTEMIQYAMPLMLLPVEEQPTEEEIAAKMVEMFSAAVSNPDVEKATTTVKINLVKVDGAWKLESDDELVDAVMGGYISYVNSGTSGVDMPATDTPAEAETAA